MKPGILLNVFAFTVTVVCSLCSSTFAQTLIDFEDLGAQLDPDSAFRGEPDGGPFSSGPITFENSFNAAFDSWNGTAYSNRTSWTLGGASGFEEFQFGNDTVVTSPTGGSGNGVNGSDTWGVFFGTTPNEARFEIAPGNRLQSLYINNTRTTAEAIENGNSFSAAFGPGDLFEVIFNSIEVAVVNGVEEVNVLASSGPIVLADGNSLVRDWTFVDLRGTGVEDARLIGLEFRSTDTGPFGINTPAYLAVDNISLVAVPEPGSLLWVLFLGASMAARRVRTARTT